MIKFLAVAAMAFFSLTGTAHAVMVDGVMDSARSSLSSVATHASQKLDAVRNAVDSDVLNKLVASNSDADIVVQRETECEDGNKNCGGSRGSQATPLPGSLPLFGIALLGVAYLARRKANSSI